jgi:hypothetical protein
MTNCAECFHPFENHHNVDGTPNTVCNGTIECDCPKYVPQVLYDYAQEIEKIKFEGKKIYMRCKFVLEKVPGSRNATEKTFPKIYKEIWYGFKIRKEGTKYTTDDWKRMPSDDKINREKRRVKEDHPALRTYDPNVIQHQETTFQAYLEMAIEK